MLLKCSILGLILLLAGGFAYGWVYNDARDEQQQAPDVGLLKNTLGPEEYLAKYGRWYTLSPEQQNQLLQELNRDREGKTKEQLAREQQARLWADRDKLAGGQMNPGDIADFLYGAGWQNTVEQYKKRQQQRDFVQTISIVCLSLGGTVSGACLLAGLVYLAIRIVKALMHRSAEPLSEPEPKAPELTDLELHIPPPAEEPEPPQPQERPRQRRRVLALSDMPGESSSAAPTSQESGGVDTYLSSVIGRPAGGNYPSFAAQTAPVDSAVAVLLTDKQAEEQGWSAEAQWSAKVALGVAGEENLRPNPAAAQPVASVTPVVEEIASPVRDILKEQTDSLQKQIAEFKQMAQDVQQTTRQHSEPLSSTLKELAEQVSAIRDYAATQQGRVEKLQDGYDWGIIRSFGLRVIRCLDNLENRIAELPSENEAVRHLEEVRDELLFALESSSIEQYRPDLHSDYRGQEKMAETIKEREPPENPQDAGKIAKVLRPGYRYMMDDENYKVVRTAQVKLFG
jgi:molecular chaperone GrpE (heat shock protein)